MKKFQLAVLAVFVIALSTATLVAQDKKEMKEITVTGEVIDVKCYLTGMMGGRGGEHEDCAIACMKGGLPPGIVEDGTGTVYILAPEKGMKGGNESLVKYAAKTVTVKGKVVEKGGSKILLYSSLEAK